jgi:LPS-assembly protein
MAITGAISPGPALLRERLVPSTGVLSWGRNDHSVTLVMQQWQVQQQVDSPIVPPFDRMPQLVWRYTPTICPAGWISAGKPTPRVFAPTTSMAATIWNGQRSYALAQLSRSFLAPGWFIKPKVQIHTASYQLDNTVINGQTSFQRTLPTFSLDSGLVFERDTTFFGKDYVQTLEPRAFYAYTPYRDQSMLPVYDTARSTSTSPPSSWRTAMWARTALPTTMC